MMEALRTIIRQVMARVDFLAFYPARVASQNSDGTLELVPDDARLPGLSRVPLRSGVPGVRATIANASRVFVGFEGGDPRMPFALVWEQGTVTKLEVTATEVVFNQGSTPVAKEGSATAGHAHTVTFALTAGPYPVAGTITVQSNTDTIASGEGAQDVLVS